MSKSESAGAKSLEEILASIRKSLAEEASDRAPEGRSTPAGPAQAQPKPSASAPAKAAGPLAGKLAGALNGSAHRPLSDPDLNDLLAKEPKKSVAPAPLPNGGEAEPAGDAEKDPLWFLNRLSEAATAPAAQGPAARARDAAKAPGQPAEDIKLSRPETLRASLPPLFEPTRSKHSQSDPRAETVSSTVRTEPRGLPQATDAPGPTKPGHAPEATQAVPSAPVAEARASATASPLPSLSIDPIPAAEPSRSSPIEAEGAAARPAAPEPDKAPERASNSPEPTRAGSQAAVGGVQTRALEQTLAGLLEPVIRQWLQKHLPALIEKVVREEVAKAVAAERAAGKV